MPGEHVGESERWFSYRSRQVAVLPHSCNSPTGDHRAVGQTNANLIWKIADLLRTAEARSMREKGINATDIAKMLGVSRATVYRYLAIDESAAV
jgi:transcriptional regulator of acetoin/glycerol metabolism